jgi:hypothetical protein
LLQSNIKQHSNNKQQNRYELKILDILESLRKKLRSTKQSDLTLDLIAALRVVETTFHGTESLSFTRLMLSSLCFDVLTVKGMLRSKEINMARLFFLNLETLHDWQNRLVSACDCSLLFWSLPLLDHFLDNIYAKPPQSHRLYHIMTAFQDPLHILMSAKHVKSPQELRENYADTLKQAFQDRVIQPLCRAIDSDLRGFVMSVTLDQDNLRPNPKTRKRVRGIWCSSAKRENSNHIPRIQRTTLYYAYIVRNHAPISLKCTLECYEIHRYSTDVFLR